MDELTAYYSTNCDTICSLTLDLVILTDFYEDTDLIWYIAAQEEVDNEMVWHLWMNYGDTEVLTSSGVADNASMADFLRDPGAFSDQFS